MVMMLIAYIFDRTGEIAAINNCTKLLTDPEGKYKLSGPEALKALGDLSLYTTAEACPMVSLITLPTSTSLTIPNPLVSRNFVSHR